MHTTTSSTPSTSTSNPSNAPADLLLPFQTLGALQQAAGGCSSLTRLENSKALFEASERGDTHKVLKMLEAGADPNFFRSHRALTPLMAASANNHPNVVLSLLLNGASPLAFDEKGYTAIVHACKKGHTEVVRLLLPFGTEHTPSHWLGRKSALMVACKHGHEEIVDLLLESGANVNASSSTGWTAAMFACHRGHRNIVQKLVQKGADLGAQHSEGWNALMIVCENGRVDILDIIMPLVPDLYAHTRGWNALLIACMKNNSAVVDRLVQQGFDVNHLNESGQSPLMVAEMNFRTDVVSKLIALGATGAQYTLPCHPRRRCAFPVARSAPLLSVDSRV